MNPIEISENIYRTKKFTLFTHASRLAFLCEMSEKSQGLVVLDVGAGIGGTSYYFCKKGNRVYSFDLDYRVLRDCGMLIKDIQYPYGHRICGSASHLPFKRNAFNLVIMSEVIYLMEQPDIERAFREIKLVLNDQGMMLISQCNLLNFHIFRNYCKRVIKTLFGCRRPEEKGRIFDYPSYKLIKLIKRHFRIIAEYGVPSLTSQINYYVTGKKSIKSFSKKWLIRHLCFSYFLICQKK